MIIKSVTIVPISERAKEFCKNNNIVDNKYSEISIKFPTDFKVCIKGIDTDGGECYITPFGKCMIFEGIDPNLSFKVYLAQFLPIDKFPNSKKDKIIEEFKNQLTGIFAKYGDMLEEYIISNEESGYLITREDVNNIIKDIGSDIILEYRYA